MLQETDNPWFEIILVEGKNRQIRRMFEQIGHHVEKIKRVRFGPLLLNLDTGRSRELNKKEIAALQAAASGQKVISRAESVARQRAVERRGRPSVKRGGRPIPAKKKRH